MDHLLKQLAAAAQAHTPHPLTASMGGLAGAHLYAAAAGWAPFLGLHSGVVGASAGACGAASVHMLRHMALLQRANAAASKLQQHDKEQQHDEEEQEQEQLQVDVEQEEEEEQEQEQLEQHSAGNEGKLTH